MKRILGGAAGFGLSLALWVVGSAQGGLVRTEVWGQPVLALHLTPGAQTIEKIDLAGARNEHLFLPVLVEGEAASLQAEMQGLPKGVECRFYRVVSVPPGPPGKVPPDALVPLEEDFLVPASGPLPLWVSLKIPPSCPPGSYPLNLVPRDRQGSACLPLELKVYRFTLPDDLPITIFGGFWHQHEPWVREGGQSPLEVPVIKAYYQSLREYKVNALGGSYPLPLNQLRPGQRLEDFSTYHELLRYALEELGFRYFQMPRLWGWTTVNQPESSFDRQARFFYPLYEDYLRRHGWEKRALNYLADEPQPERREAVRQAYALAKTLAPGVRTLSAGWRPSPDLVKVIDIWAYQASRYQEGKREGARLRGQEAWLYMNRLHGADHPLAHPRLIGWLLYRYQFSGYLLWGVNYWPGNPWSAPPGPKDFLRRGTFYYPHPRTGRPVPTTRLEALRRGFQDYQYLWLLDQAHQRGLVAPERQAAIQAKIRRLTENLPRNPFPVSMAELEELRLEVGEVLDQAGWETDEPRSQ